MFLRFFVFLCFLFLLVACDVVTDPPIEEPDLLKITNITFNDETVIYDGNKHSIFVQGTLPEGIDVTYLNNDQSEVGTYLVTVTLSGTNYETLVLNANLVIEPVILEVFTDISFESKTYTYDGNLHKIEITGNLPSGTNVSYTSTTEDILNAATEVGVYQITATIVKEGYETLVLTATLTISEASNLTFTGVRFDNLSIEYDSFEHEIVVEGILPEGTIVNYQSNVSGVTNKAIEAGVYEVTATLSKIGYETLVLDATLTIKAVDKERFIFNIGESIYFNNGLDEENLYIYDQEGLSKVNNDEARFILTHQGQMLYVSNGLLSDSIRSLNGTISQTVFTANAEYLISDDLNLYYAINSFFGESGIYQLNIDTEEPVLRKLFDGKAKYLTMVDDFIYFANGNDGYKLYKISKTEVNPSATLVVDEKIKELIYYNRSFYFTVNHLLGDYLARYMMDTQTTIKLTSDNAKYLVIADGYVYYSNVDLLNSEIFGKGLYRVPATGTTDNPLPGELIYETEYNVSSLYTMNQDTILFYRISDKHLLSYSISTSTVIDLMEGFISPVEDTPQLLPKFESSVWHNRVYYINNYVDGALFYYDTKTNENIRVTSNGVKSFSIIGDILYFNQISWLINNDLYMINLKQGGVAEKISNNDGRDMVIHNGFLYYVKENAMGVGTAIASVSLDDSLTEIEIYTYNAHNLSIYDNKLYFIKGSGVDEIWRADILSNGDITNFMRLGTDKTDWFIIYEGEMYYRAVGTFSKTLSKMNLDGTNKTVIITGYDPISFMVFDEHIYFTNDTLLSPADGIYRADLDGSNIELLYENTDLGDGFGIEMNISGVYLYYYSKSDLLGDFKFHRLNLTTLTSEIIE